MRRVLLAGFVLAAGGLALAPADEPADTSPLGRKLARLRKDFEADHKQLQKKLADAKDADEKKHVNFQIKELHAITASDVIELAEEGKKDQAGLDAAVFALELLGKFQVTGQDMDKVCDLILKYHVDSPKIAPALAGMAECGPTGLTFLETVVEKATDANVKALALYYNALAVDARAGRNEGRASDETITKERASAADLMEKAVKLAPEAKIGTDTLARAAEAELVSLRIGVGNPVPEIEGTDLTGKKVKLSSYRGKAVLFDFWATWCGPCVGMIPHERELLEKQKGKPFTILSVNVDDERATAMKFLGEEKMPWEHWYDGPKGPVCKMFRIHAYPTLFLIDAKGIVRKKWTGVPGNEALDKAVDEVLAGAK